jgi:hypothetical protein
MKGRRTDLPTAALVKVLKETEGRSENEISSLTGIPAGTVHNIISGAHGWGKIADGDLFKRQPGLAHFLRSTTACPHPQAHTL